MPDPSRSTNPLVAAENHRKGMQCKPAYKMPRRMPPCPVPSGHPSRCCEHRFVHWSPHRKGREPSPNPRALRQEPRPPRSPNAYYRWTRSIKRFGNIAPTPAPPVNPPRHAAVRAWPRWGSAACQSRCETAPPAPAHRCSKRRFQTQKCPTGHLTASRTRHSESHMELLCSQLLSACASSPFKKAIFSAILASSPRGTGWYQAGSAMPSGK